MQPATGIRSFLTHGCHQHQSMTFESTSANQRNHAYCHCGGRTALNRQIQHVFHRSRLSRLPSRIASAIAQLTNRLPIRQRYRPISSPVDGFSHASRQSLLLLLIPKIQLGHLNILPSRILNSLASACVCQPLPCMVAAIIFNGNRIFGICHIEQHRLVGMRVSNGISRIFDCH